VKIERVGSLRGGENLKFRGTEKNEGRTRVQGLFLEAWYYFTIKGEGGVFLNVKILDQATWATGALLARCAASRIRTGGGCAKRGQRK